MPDVNVWSAIVPSFLYLQRPVKEDIRALDAYLRGRGKGWMALQPLRRFMRDQYLRYPSGFNEPSILQLPKSLQSHSELLFHLYSSRKGVFSYIREIRMHGRKLGCCPYCGLPGNITLDHYLPRSVKGFPQFSVLSLNLVPACCDCQSAKSDYFPTRKVTRKSSNKHVSRMRTSKRIVHPYFDHFLTKPVLKVIFSVNNEVSIGASVVCKPHERRLIEFHLLKLQMQQRIPTVIDRYKETVIAEFRTLDPLNITSALERLTNMVGVAEMRAGDAINCIEATYLRSLLFDQNEVNQLISTALIPIPKLKPVSRAIVHI